jgi:general secretion pathway protein E/type IV pilus assembly protein PilB
MEAGEILLSKGLLDERQLRVLRENSQVGTRPDRVAVQMGFVTEEQALVALADALGMIFVDLTTAEPDLSLLADFPAKLMHRHGLFPLRREGESLVVVTDDPFDLYAIDAVAAATGHSIRPALAVGEEIAKLIKTHLGMGSETIDHLLAQRQAEGQVEVLDELEVDGSEDSQAAQEASVVRLVNEILVEAIQARASDIHIEAQAAGMKIRYRIDGVLQPTPTPPEINHFQAAIVSRLKIMAHLNIAEKRLPQDGRIKLKVAGREVDVRVSIIPMLHGEGIVMRVLDKDRMQFSLRGVGMDEDIYERFLELIRLPHGIVLVTGPTGSGKTTTLYSALAEIKDEATKIITTEDPVEYQLAGINQIQVHHKIGLTFAASLRAILRHDPDVVLVGEIRDLETAENAVQASLTGHLVFSTLHTNDAAGAYMRLVDMGVEPFLVASTVEGVMAQRLVRTLCTHCRQEYRPDGDDVPADFPLDECLSQDEPIFRPVGCKECRQTGYRGRVGLYELLTSNEEIRELANQRISSHKLKEVGIRHGMMTLRQNGWRKVLQGRTSIEEVTTVAKAD